MTSGSNPLSHVVQHPIKTVPADMGPLTPQGEITVMSDQIAMILGAGLLLMVFLPPLFRRKDDLSLEGMVPTGFANLIETICQYLRKEVAEPALGPYTDRFIQYIWKAIGVRSAQIIMEIIKFIWFEFIAQDHKCCCKAACNKIL